MLNYRSFEITQGRRPPQFVTSTERFGADGKHFENVTNVTIITDDCCVFRVLLHSVDGKHLIYFQSETIAFKLIRRSVDEAQKKTSPNNYNLLLVSLDYFSPKVFLICKLRVSVLNQSFSMYGVCTHLHTFMEKSTVIL